VPTRVVVHIGTQKSGSTYVQQVVRAVEAPLRAAGWCYPLAWAGRRGALNQEPATYGAVPGGYSWVSRERASALTAAWASLCAEVSAHPGEVLVSAEALATLRSEDAEVVIADLLRGCPPGTPCEVVITARDLGRILPSAWQQHVRNGRGETYPGYLERLVAERETSDHDGDVVAGFWRAYRIAGLAQRWAGLPGVSRVTVVPVPRQGGSARLWHLFAAACQLSGIVAEPPEIPRDAANIGITAPEAYALAALSRGMRAAGVTEQVATARRFRIVREGFSPRPQRGQPLAVPEALRDLVAAWAHTDADDVAELAAAGLVAIEGDPADLRCSFAAAPADPGTEEVLAAVAAAVAVLQRPEPVLRRSVPPVGGGPLTVRQRIAQAVPLPAVARRARLPVR